MDSTDSSSPAARAPSSGTSKILLMMGSESDRPIMEPGAAVLCEQGVEVEMVVSSAHRNPDRTAKLASEARERGFSIIICGAGLSAALPGVVAAHTDLPVIGVPIAAGSFGGMDALLSMVQMPPGVPVATVGINGATNAAFLALRILRSVEDDGPSACCEGTSSHP